MLISDISNSGAIPVLEAMVRFSGARQRVLASNVANLDTPDYRPLDVSPAEFQRALGEAVEARRRGGGESSPLSFAGTDQVCVEADGRMTATPRTPSGNILFHDRNNRDLERTMSDMAENQLVFRASVELLRSRYGIMQAAISERV